ncbi:MAG: hypothetical protein ACI4U3_09395 [Traorella sp.]
MNKGNSLINSILFFFIVVLIVNYVVVLIHSIQKIQQIDLNRDNIYEEAYQ